MEIPVVRRAALLIIPFAIIAGTPLAAADNAPLQTLTPDLEAIAHGIGAKIPPEVALEWAENAKGRPALRIRPTVTEISAEDEWVVELSGLEFTEGEIEFDVLGRSEPPQSNFLGFAFRVVDETTHDAVYFRPFNFRAADPVRRAHAVQYISHPGHPWYALRKDKPGQYEKPIDPPPDGDDWFHARIVIRKPHVSVYVDGESEPSLVVAELSARQGGGIGLWVGPGAGGYLANLRITPAAKH